MSIGPEWSFEAPIPAVLRFPAGLQTSFGTPHSTSLHNLTPGSPTLERHDPLGAPILPCSVDEASYNCDNCGESIVVPIDQSAGRDQEYVEDCPVCCSPNVLRVTIAPDGSASIQSRSC